MLTSLIALCLFGQSPEIGHFIQPGILFLNVNVLDGNGGPSYKASVVVFGDKIAGVNRLPDEPYPLGLDFPGPVIDGTGLVLAPGFIDSHSHADFAVDKDPVLESQIRQGITTAVVGQDGIWNEPYADAMTRIQQKHPTINFAAFSGHGGIRGKVMGEDWERWSGKEEREQMKALVEADMKAGALGLSSGLEYNPAFFGNTEEVIDLAKVASKYKGIYISHVRNEDATALQSFGELIRIAKEAKIPAQISHIKLALPSVWGQSKQAIKMFDEARKSGLDITADIYPYTFWQSTITVLTSSREWDRIGVWRQAVKDLGGADKIRLGTCTYKREWEGKTIQELAEKSSREPAEIIQEIVLNTYGPGKSGQASVNVTAMGEPDIVRFMKWPHTSICSDGVIGGSHPRVAGTFPRVLGYYVREANVLSLPEAIRKMTSLPAKRFGFKDRGVIKPGMKADVVLFDPNTVVDSSTPKNPASFAKGIKFVIVNGKIVLNNGKVTNERPGQIITRTGAPFKPVANLPKLASVDHLHDDCCGG